VRIDLQRCTKFQPNMFIRFIPLFFPSFSHSLQGDHLSGKPGNVREFDSVGEKILVREKLHKLFIVKFVTCIFASIRVFRRSLYMVSDRALMQSSPHH